MPFEERHGYPLALLYWPPFFSLAVVRGLPLGESDVLPIVELLVFLVGKVAEAVPLRTALCVESDLDVHVNYGGLRHQHATANERVGDKNSPHRRLLRRGPCSQPSVETPFSPATADQKSPRADCGVILVKTADLFTLWLLHDDTYSKPTLSPVFISSRTDFDTNSSVR